MSYKHANAVAVKSKTKGMQKLVFRALAGLIQDDGYLIEGQNVLAANLGISIGCLRKFTNHFQAIGELQKIGGRGNGNATRYRSLLGEMENKDMLAHFKEIEAERKYQLEKLKGTHHAPFNEDTKGTHHAPLGEIKGTPQDVKGTPQDVKGTPQDVKGTHRAPSNTTNTTNTTHTKDEKTLATTDSYKPPPCPYEKISEFWNSSLPTLSAVAYVSKEDKTKLQKSWNEVCLDAQLTEEKALEWFKDYFLHFKSSDFLMGTASNSNGWAATFDWAINIANLKKVVIGDKYHKPKPKPKPIQYF